MVTNLPKSVGVYRRRVGGGDLIKACGSVARPPSKHAASSGQWAPPGCHDRHSGHERDPAPITLELLPRAALHRLQGTAGSLCLRTPMRAPVPSPRCWSAGRRGNVTAAEGSDTSTSPSGRWTRFGSEGLGGLRSEVSVQCPTHRPTRHSPTLLPSAEWGPAACSRRESGAGQATFSCRSCSPSPRQVVRTRACYTFILRCYLFI